MKVSKRKASAVLCLLLCVGCEPLIPPRPPIEGQQAATAAAQGPSEQGALAGGQNSPPPTAVGDSAKDAVPGVVGQEAITEWFEGPWGQWYLHRRGGKVIGVTHFDVDKVLDRPLQTPNEQQVDYTRTRSMLVEQGSLRFVRSQTIQFREAEDGHVRQFQLSDQAGPIQNRLTGTCVRERLNLSIDQSGQQSRQALAWSPKTRGMFVAIESLRRRMVEVGEIRRFQFVLPSLQEIGTLQLECLGDASVPMFDGSYQKLREVEVTTFRQGVKDQLVVHWVNDQGKILRTLDPQQHVESFAVERAQAELLFDPPKEDQWLIDLNVSKLNLDPSEPSPSEALARQLTLFQKTNRLGRVAYEIQLADEGDPSDANSVHKQLFTSVPSLPGQQVRHTEGSCQVLIQQWDHRGLIQTTRDERDKQTFDVDTEQAFAVPTQWLDANATVVGNWSRLLIDQPSVSDVLDLARRMTNQLSLELQGPFQPASAVLSKRKGGTIDHAVALAAILRSKQIPAQVVFGIHRSTYQGRLGDYQDQAANGEVFSVTSVPLNEQTQAGQPAVAPKVWAQASAWVLAKVDGRWVSINAVNAKLTTPDYLCLIVPQPEEDLHAAYQRFFRSLPGLTFDLRALFVEGH